MRKVIAFLVMVLVLGCHQGKEPIVGETEFQKKMNADFRDATSSPLKGRAKKNFKGLDFFKFDSAYVVTAQLKRTPDSKWFNMKTNTDRLSRERVYGVLTFELQGQTYQLNVYQGEDSITSEDQQDYLFLPFLDNTNGETTYGGGRYIDLKIPEGDTIVVDFNKAYNPYCAYNENYSCPIVPRVNYLDTNIQAGVKAYKK